MPNYEHQNYKDAIATPLLAAATTALSENRVFYLAVSKSRITVASD